MSDESANESTKRYLITDAEYVEQVLPTGNAWIPVPDHDRNFWSAFKDAVSHGAVKRGIYELEFYTHDGDDGDPFDACRLKRIADAP